MKTLLIIDTVHGGIFFPLTYLAAFVVTAGIMINTGHRKGYPKSSWLLILLTGIIFFIIGNKMFTYTPEQWTQVFTGGKFPAAGKKTILGGIVGLFAGILLAKTFLRFHRPVMDTLAVALPLGMAISRIGCLFAGCCYGTPSNLLWAVRYDPGSPAFNFQESAGLIDPHASCSMPVHPVQLYQVIGCLAIAFFIWKTRKFWRSGGSLFLFSVLSYAVFRLFVEFVRAPESNEYAGQYFLGLKVIQWLILAGILPVFLILIFREARPKPCRSLLPQKPVSGLNELLLITFLSIIIFLGRKWFDLLEFSTIMVFLGPVIIVLFVKWYKNYSVAGFRWVSPVVLVFGFSFLAQKNDTTYGEDENVSFTNIGLTGMIGTYTEEVGQISKIYVPGSCNDPGYYKEDLNPIGDCQRTFYQGGLDVSRHIWQGKYNKIDFGARGFLGFETGGIKADHPSGTSFGISPYFNFNWEWIGFGLGLSVGQMKLPLGHKKLDGFSDGEIVSTGYRNVYFFPSARLRVGPYDEVFLEAGIPSLFPSSSPYPLFQAGIGSGFGKTNGTKAVLGYCYRGIFAEMKYPFKNNLVLSAFYADNLSMHEKSNRVLSVGVSWNLLKKHLEQDK